MKNIRSAVVGFLTLVMAIGAWAAPVSAEIKLGVLPRLSKDEMTSMFTPLARYLAKETGEKVTVVIPKDFESFKQAVRTGEVDLGFSNPLIYVQLKKEVNITPLALSAEPKAGTRFRGIIIAHKKSGIEKLGDLKGKRIAFVDKDSAAGYIFQVLLLSKAGFDVKKDFTTVFAGKHDNVVMSVFNKTADAGGIREDDFEKMRDKVDLDQVRIIAYTDYFPNWPIYGAPKLTKDVSAKVKAALLKLKIGGQDTGAVLNPAKLSGFVDVADKDYEQLRQAAKLAGAL
jgi:phosphonate transport system substrate-binding protein